jgi:hypothetical protein
MPTDLDGPTFTCRNHFGAESAILGIPVVHPYRPAVASVQRHFSETATGRNVVSVASVHQDQSPRHRLTLRPALSESRVIRPERHFYGMANRQIDM